jgi:hypothetical protein
MKLFLNHPIKWGLAAFVAMLFITRPIVQPTTCADGWRSPSIGRQGACSWHGGVGTNWSAILASLLNIGGGLAVGGGLYGIRERREEAERLRLQKIREAEEQAELERLRAQAKAEGIACPNCGCPMEVRSTWRRNRKQFFRGCVRFPECRGTRPVTKEEQESFERPPREEDGWERID